MQIQHNISLKNYNTFGIEVCAKHFVSIHNIEDLKTILQINEYKNHFILGGGSNLLLTQDIEALVIHINLKGITIVSEDDNSVLVEVKAGENWHEFVLWCIAHNFGGLENLSLIPGNVGTAPIQNIGAYGVELKDNFISCKTLDINTLKAKTFNKAECKFDYRNSIFKQDLKGKQIITSVTFKLSKRNHILHTKYGAIALQLRAMFIEKPTISDISNAVIAIRESKLPNPNDIGNSGSFFKNPVISLKKFENLKQNFPEIPGYTISSDAIKIPAGWLIEKAGFKGKRLGNYGVHDKQALVLVNYGNANGADILKLSQTIQKTIKRIFYIEIEAEVNIL